MTAAERLAYVGLPDTPEGRETFYDMFDDESKWDDFYSQEMARGGTTSTYMFPQAFYQDGGATDGIAYPQQPTSQYMFEGASWYPSYKEHGGIAYPQQPTADVFFSANPWQPHYEEGGQYGGSASPLGYGQMPPVMDFGGMSKGDKKTFLKSFVDNYMKYAYGGNASQMEADTDPINYPEKIRNNFVSKLQKNATISRAEDEGKAILNNLMQNNQVEPMAFNYGGGMDYDWDSMRNPNAQAQADMYNNMADEYENQAMNSTQQAGQNLFDIGKQFMNNRNAINAQTEAAKNFAASTMTGAEAARGGSFNVPRFDPGGGFSKNIGPDPGNLFKKSTPIFFPNAGAPAAPAAKVDPYAGLNQAQILRKQLEEKYPTSNTGQQNQSYDLAQLLGQYFGTNPNQSGRYVFAPTFGDPFDYKGRNQYGKFRLRSYGPGIFNPNAGNVYGTASQNTGNFNFGNMSKMDPNQLAAAQQYLKDKGISLEYSQQNRKFFNKLLGPKSFSLKYNIGNSSTGTTQPGAAPTTPVAPAEAKKPGFFDRMKEKNQARKATKEAARYEEFKKNNPVYPNEKTPTGAPVISPLDQSNALPNANSNSNWSMMEKPGLVLDPNSPGSSGPVMSPMQRANALPAGTQSVPYTPRPTINPNDSTPTGPVMEPLDQSGAVFNYGGYYLPKAVGGFDNSNLITKDVGFQYDQNLNPFTGVGQKVMKSMPSIMQATTNLVNYHRIGKGLEDQAFAKTSADANYFADNRVNKGSKMIDPYNAASLDDPYQTGFQLHDQGRAFQNSNIKDSRYGGNLYPDGGQVGDIMYLSDEDVARFMAEGGTIEFLD